MKPARHILRAALMSPAFLLLAATLPLQAHDPDGRIAATIRSSYNFQSYLAGDSITVRSSGGLVTLTGTVAEDYHRALAADTAAGIKGVKGVRNNLTLRAEQPAASSDAWITLKVKGALAFHKNVSAAATEVETRDGVVTLKGRTGSRAQLELTTEYVKDVDGVRAVDNAMTVNGELAPETTGAIDDASITAQIKTSLLFHRSTQALGTRVTTRNGVVVLLGEVNTAAEKHLIGKLAEDIHGVKRVDNRLSVKTS